MTTTSAVKNGKVRSVREAARARAAGIIGACLSPCAEALSFAVDFYAHFLKDGKERKEAQPAGTRKLVYVFRSEKAELLHGIVFIHLEIARVYAARGTGRCVFVRRHSYREPTAADLEREDIKKQIEALR